MSEDFLQSVEDFLASVEQELSTKIKNLDSKLDRLTEDNKNLKKNIAESGSIFKEKKEEFFPYNRIIELERILHNQKAENQILYKKIKKLENDLKSKESTLNTDPLDTAEYILAHLKESLFELAKTFSNASQKSHLSSEHTDLDDEAKRYVSHSNLQSIDEKISIKTPLSQFRPESSDLSQQNDQSSLKNGTKIGLVENLQQELSYRKQQVNALQKIIDEGEIESDLIRNENTQLKNELEELKTTFETLEQKSHESFLEIERKERESREAESLEDRYKNELEQLRLALSKRKDEIKELKILLSSESDKKQNIIEEYEKQLNNIKTSFSDLEKRYFYIMSELNEIVHERKNVASDDLIDVEELLQEFKLLMKLSGRVYAPKGYLTVLNYLNNNPEWIDLHYLAKQVNMNPGVLHNLLLELVDMNLIDFNEVENRTRIR